VDCMHGGAGNSEDVVVWAKIFGGGFVDDFC